MLLPSSAALTDPRSCFLFWLLALAVLAGDRQCTQSDTSIEITQHIHTSRIAAKSTMPVKLHRIAHWLWAHGVPLIPHLIKIFNRIVFAVVLPPSARLGKGVLLSYHGLGTVIHRNARIGDRVSIGAGVTIGGRSGHSQVPVIDDDAMIGAGAKILACPDWSRRIHRCQCGCAQ